MILALASLFLAASWWLLLRWTTGLDALNKVLDKSAGHVLEIGLYKDEPRPMMASFWDLCRSSLELGRALLAPAVLFLLPLLLVSGPLISCYEHRSLKVEENVLLWVQAEFDDIDSLQLDLPAGIEMDSGPVRDATSGDVAWRLQATEPGTYRLRLTKSGQSVEKRLRVEQGLKPLNPQRSKSWLHWVWQPTESVLPGDAWADRVRLDYPKRELWLMDRVWPWWLLLLLGFLLAATLTRRLGQ